MRTACLKTMHASVATAQMTLLRGSLSEQVWTGLQWPPDVTSRGVGAMSDS